MERTRTSSPDLPRRNTYTLLRWKREQYQLVDHVGSNNGIITGIETTGTSEYGPTVIFTNHLYTLQNAPSFTNYATISFYYKVGSPHNGVGTGVILVGRRR